MKDELSFLLPHVLLIAKNVSDLILKIGSLADHYDVLYKQNYSPVTVAEIESNKLICKLLKSLTPKYPVLSEEGELISFDERHMLHKYWLIDPLDGTKEFIAGSKNFTINIALIENNLPFLGVVVDPTLNRMYWAIKKGNAYMQVGNCNARIIKVGKARSPLIIAIRKPHVYINKLKKLLNLLGQCQFITYGSTIKICLVASGVADMYPRFGKTFEWV